MMQVAELSLTHKPHQRTERIERVMGKIRSSLLVYEHTLPLHKASLLSQCQMVGDKVPTDETVAVKQDDYTLHPTP